MDALIENYKSSEYFSQYIYDVAVRNNKLEKFDGYDPAEYTTDTAVIAADSNQALLLYLLQGYEPTQKMLEEAGESAALLILYDPRIQVPVCTTNISTAKAKIAKYAEMLKSYKTKPYYSRYIENEMRRNLSLLYIDTLGAKSWSHDSETANIQRLFIKILDDDELTNGSIKNLMQYTESGEKAFNIALHDPRITPDQTYLTDAITDENIWAVRAILKYPNIVPTEQNKLDASNLNSCEIYMALLGNVITMNDLGNAVNKGSKKCIPLLLADKRVQDLLYANDTLPETLLTLAKNDPEKTTILLEDEHVSYLLKKKYMLKTARQSQLENDPMARIRLSKISQSFKKVGLPDLAIANILQEGLPALGVYNFMSIINAEPSTTTGVRDWSWVLTHNKEANKDAFKIYEMILKNPAIVETEYPDDSTRNKTFNKIKTIIHAWDIYFRYLTQLQIQNRYDNSIRSHAINAAASLAVEYKTGQLYRPHDEQLVDYLKAVTTEVDPIYLPGLELVIKRMNGIQRVTSREHFVKKKLATEFGPMYSLDVVVPTGATSSTSTKKKPALSQKRLQEMEREEQMQEAENEIQAFDEMTIDQMKEALGIQEEDEEIHDDV